MLTTTLIVCGLAVLMMAVEKLRPGRYWPSVPYWLGRAAFMNAIQAGIVFLSSLTWDRWLPTWQMGKAASLGIVVQVICGYLAITFIYYWWHRARHEAPLLWRWLHQIHHSAQRLEILTSFYKHPLEIFINGILSSLILYVLVGVEPLAGAIVVALTGIAELFYHWNIRTPYWLGFLVQRPESHCIHHRSGWHRNNYSDLPIWDILFGTFENPRHNNIACGFDAQREQKLRQMLCGKDVHALTTTRSRS